MLRVLSMLFTLALFAVGTTPARAQELAIPTIPDAVEVKVNRGTTALLVLDILESNCRVRPACLESVPNITSLLSWARAEGLHVVHSNTGPTSVFLPEVVPLEGEPVVGSSADKFFNTNLNDILQERGVATVIVVGTAATGAVLYTSFGAATRGYTVVVAEDGISSNLPFQTFLARYQLLTGPGTANPENEPLRPRVVTLSRSSLISIA